MANINNPKYISKFNKYDARFIKNNISPKGYDLFMSTHRGAILSFYIDHDGRSYSQERLERWLEDDSDTEEFLGFYMSYMKQDGMICLYGDDSIFEDGETPVCLPREELKALVNRWLQLKEEYPPAITLHWEDEHPVLTPWYDVDLSDYGIELPHGEKKNK